MQNYLESSILIILNQSLQDFEIIIINDNPDGKTDEILKKYSFSDKRIKIINHYVNKGVYYSRMESIFHANGNKKRYILLIDPDDLYLTWNLFQLLFDYNINDNFGIIEFSVFHQTEGRRNLFSPKTHLRNHFHNFSKSIIYQPELSDLLFKIPNTKKYSSTICRNIWNKLIRKEIFIEIYKYIGNDYLNEFIIRADDTLINIMVNNFANNYSNIYIPGYLYNLRRISMFRGKGGIQLRVNRTKNIILYFQLFYKFIQQLKKIEKAFFMK